MSKLTLSQLETFLLDACDLLREGGSESTDYKYYLFGMLFLKRINDQFAVAQEEKRREFAGGGMALDLITELLDDPDHYAGGF